MKPSGARTLVGGDLELLFKRTVISATTQQSQPVTLAASGAGELTKQDGCRHNELLRQQLQKKAQEAENRSQLKTRRLVELCGQVLHAERKSELWFAKYEKFFRSPVWKLVSDEAIRRAHFKCEYWKCTRQATRVHLLEFPEEHLEANFDWMNRDNILIALCNQHHWMMQGFVMKRVVPLGRQFDLSPNCFSGVSAKHFRQPGSGSFPTAKTV